MSLDLEDVTLGVGKDGEQVDNDILRLHVQDEGEGQGLGLAGGDLDVVADGGQVAEDTGPLGGIFGQRLGGGQHSTNEGKLDRLILKVLHLDDRPCRVAVDELDTETRVGEVRGNIDLQVGGVASVRVCLRILWLLFKEEVSDTWCETSNCVECPCPVTGQGHVREVGFAHSKHSKGRSSR